MAQIRNTRKISDTALIEMNSVGLSFKTIAAYAMVTPGAISKRWKVLRLAKTDTRRNFMDQIFNSLSFDQQEYLIQKLGPTTSIKDYLRNLIIKDFFKDRES